MTDSFNRPGAVDLSALAAQAQQPASQAKTGAGGYVTDVTEATLDALLQSSMDHPVVLELWSPRAQGADQLSTDLIELTNAAGGAWVLGRVNVDAEPRIAQALQAQAVPLVIAVLMGQPLPLFQGTRPRAEVKLALDQVTQAATANGMVGRAQPFAPAAADDADAGPTSDPRFEAADAALEAGDFALAVAEFDKLLQQTPHDAEVIAGRAQADLLRRTAEVDPAAVAAAADAAPDDQQAQFAAADVEFMGGAVEAAFERLLAVVRATGGDAREAARQRLVELFTVLGAGDDRVVAARRALARALF